MGAQLQATAFTGIAVSILDICENLRSKGITCDIQQIEIFDNWEFLNLKTYPSNLDVDFILQQIIQGRICIYRIQFNTSFLGGVISSKVNENVFETSAWLNIDKLPWLDIDLITDNNKSFYNVLTKSILEIFINKKFIIAGIGVETLVEYQTDMQQVISDGHGVVRWIAPIQLSQDWIETELNNFTLDKNR